MFFFMLRSGSLYYEQTASVMHVILDTRKIFVEIFVINELLNSEQALEALF